VTERPDADAGDRATRGLALMREMLGDEAIDRITARNVIAPDWQRWTTEVLFGDLWQGSGLTRSQRSLVTVAALIPLNRPRELAIHLRAALVNGVTLEELVQVAQHVGFYAGWPAVGEALFVLSDIAAGLTRP
jgi:4-carboxymuconolactone decarboxylase